jgi:4-amino-4-deoxy-L-arabinose transferase-like glycosyltransferase
MTTGIKTVSETMTINPNDLEPHSSDPGAGHPETRSNGQPKDKKPFSQIDPHSDVVTVTLTSEIPHGTKLTITIEADTQGNVKVNQQRTPAQPSWAQHQTEIHPPRKQSAWANWIKSGLAGFARIRMRISHFLAQIGILRNGLFFCILGILAAIIADHQLRSARAYTPTALVPLLLAGFLFTCGTWVVQFNGAGILDDPQQKTRLRLTNNKQRIMVSLFLIGFALLLSYWVVVDSINGDSHHPVWLLSRWGLGIVLVCVAIWLIQPQPDKNKGGQVASQGLGRKWLVISLVFIILIGFGLRVWHLSSIPYTLAGDEGEQGVEILRVLSSELTNPFITGWTGVPTLTFFFNAPTVALFGNTIFGLRLIWALVGTASIPVTYLLVKELKGTRLALFVTILVTTYHYHIHFSRLGSNQVSDTLLVGLTLLFLMRGYLRGKLLDWALAGVVAGIAQYFYAGGRLAVILVVFLVVYFFVLDGFKISRTHLLGLIIFLIALVVAAGPMFSYAIRFPNEYHTRANQTGVIQSGWLENEANLLGVTQAEVLLDQFKRAALAFNAYPDRISWYLLEGPLLDRVSGILFIVGVISASFWSMRDRRLAPMVAWWWGAILSGGMLTIATPQSQRLITASIPTMFFVAFAIDQISAAVRQQIRPQAGLAFSVLMIGLISIISINLYFFEFSPKRRYGGPHALIATIISEKVLEDPGPDPEIYFFGAPRMYAEFGTMRYLIPDVTKIDILDPLESPYNPDPPPQGDFLWFIFLPERLDELQYVQQSFPGGHTEAVRSVVDPEYIHYYLYTVR